MKPFILVTVASSHLWHLLQESTMICAMGSCLKMLENWRKFWMRFWSKYFLFCISKAPKYNEDYIIGLPYVKHVHQYFTLRNRISKVFMMSNFFFYNWLHSLTFNYSDLVHLKKPLYESNTATRLIPFLYQRSRLTIKFLFSFWHCVFLSKVVRIMIKNAMCYIIWLATL